MFLITALALLFCSAVLNASLFIKYRREQEERIAADAIAEVAVRQVEYRANEYRTLRTALHNALSKVGHL